MLDRVSQADKTRASQAGIQTRFVSWVRESAAHLWQERRTAGLLIGAAVLAWAFLPQLLLGRQIDVDAVTRADFVQSVVAAGHVEAPFRVNVGSQITGIVAEVVVAEGQTVKAGDPLVRLDDREGRAAVAQAEGVVAQSEARMRQLRELTLPAAEEALKQAKATLANAQSAYDRAAKLAADGFGTRATLEDATKALAIARAQLNTAEFNVFTNKPGGSDFVMAETQLLQARSSLESAKVRLDYAVVKAPRDGVLISRSVERGNVVQPSVVMMTLSPFLDTQIVVQIDERNLGLLRLGQPAIVAADAYPKEQFRAQIAYINPGVDLQRASVQVKLRVPEPPGFLRQDMTVSVDIEAARHSQVLIVPATHLRDLASGKPWVLAVNGRHTERRDVSVGLIGSGRAEILAGLSEGDLVVAPSSGVAAGRRIRPHPRPSKFQ